MDEKTQEHHRLQIDGGLLSGLQRIALVHLVHFARNKANYVGMQVHCVGGQRGGRHYSVVDGVLEFSHPCLVFVLFIHPSLLEMKFFSENFSLSVHIYHLGRQSCAIPRYQNLQEEERSSSTASHTTCSK